MKISYMMKPVKTVWRKIIAVALIAVMLVGCSYHGKIEPNLSINSSAMVKHPYSLAIDDSQLSSAQVKADPQWFNITVDAGEALTEMIKNQLSQSFNSVEVLKKGDATTTYDYIVTIDSKSVSRCSMNSCGISTKMSLQMVDTKSIDHVVLADDFLDVYTMQMPGGSYLINLFTGLSLFVLAPILQPISAHFAGKELVQRVTDSNERMSYQITKKIVGSDVYAKKVK